MIQIQLELSVCLACSLSSQLPSLVSSHHRDIRLLGGARNNCIIGEFSNISVQSSAIDPKSACANNPVSTVYGCSVFMPRCACASEVYQYNQQVVHRIDSAVVCVFNYCTHFDSCLDCSISAGKGHSKKWTGQIAQLAFYLSKCVKLQSMNILMHYY